MLPGWILLLVSVAYAALLFVVAWWGDRHPQYSQGRTWLRPLVYSLSLAVYCSSWTFYGAVGTATRTGIGYFAIYLGPLMMLLFRSEEHTSELQSIMRISYAVLCLKKKKKNTY